MKLGVLDSGTPDITDANEVRRKKELGSEH